MGKDPDEAGAVQDTITSASPARPITAVGLLGGDVTGVGAGGWTTGAAEDPDVLAEPSAYPVRVVVTVTVDDAFADNPVTVTTPLPSMDAEPREADAAHVHDASKFVTETVKPELVDTGDANTGTKPCLIVVTEPDEGELAERPTTLLAVNVNV